VTVPAASADDQHLPAVGILWLSDATQSAPYLGAFKEALRERGWIDGRTIRIVERFDDGDSSRLPGLAMELVGLGVDVLFVTDFAVPAARQASTKIPIVCADFYDPVAEGLTRSIARPDGNVTGVSLQSVASSAKRLQLAQELIPGLRRVGLLYDPSDAGAALEAKGLANTARLAGIDLKNFEVRAPTDFQAAFDRIKRSRPQALLVSLNPLTWQAFPQIGAFAARNRLPVISEMPELAEVGAVLTYGPDLPQAYRRAAYFVDRILKGAGPSELPIEQAASFHLVVNVKTVKALGLTIPESINSAATKVLQ
jgi:putative ABC transport system substrate-binding protein